MMGIFKSNVYPYAELQRRRFQIPYVPLSYEVV